MRVLNHLKTPVLMGSIFGLLTFASVQNAPALMAPAEVMATPTVHAVTIHGDAKYPRDFKHFDYANPEAPKGGKLRLSTVGSFDNLNPYILKGHAAAGSGLVFETLLESSMDEAATEYGLLATSVEVAPDKSWVTFNLRPQAKWHDGVGITANDVKFSYDTLMEKGHPFFKAYYAHVKEVRAEGKYRVTFVFDMAHNAELPMIVGQMPILPAHYWADKDFGKTTLQAPLASGPYKVKEVEAGRRIVYERVKDYWGADLPVKKGRHNFDEISFDYYRDAQVEVQAFFAGNYDFRAEHIAKEWHTAYNNDLVKSGKIVKNELKHEMPQGMQAFSFNTRKDIFADKNVRKALGMAFDFEWSNKQFAYGSYKRSQSYFSNSELASSGLPSGRELEILNEYADELPAEILTQEFKLPKTDGTGTGIRPFLREANALLDTAGWKMNAENMREKDGKLLNFEILIRSASFERWIAPWIKNLKRIGVSATLRIVDTAQYQNRMDQFDFDVTISSFGQSLSPGNEQRDFWGSENADIKGSRNVVGIKNPVVDALITRIIAAKDREELIALTRAMDRVLLWQYYVIPQWHINAHRLAYWDKFGQPKTAPKYGLAVMDTWWAKAKPE